MGRIRRNATRYGALHRQMRQRLIARYVPGVSVCARGGEVLLETDTSKLHLDHADDGDPAHYLGLSCARHNLIDQRNEANVIRLPRSARNAQPGYVSPGRPW